MLHFLFSPHFKVGRLRKIVIYGKFRLLIVIAKGQGRGDFEMDTETFRNIVVIVEDRSLSFSFFLFLSLSKMHNKQTWEAYSEWVVVYTTGEEFMLDWEGGILLLYIKIAAVLRLSQILPDCQHAISEKYCCRKQLGRSL